MEEFCSSCTDRWYIFEALKDRKLVVFGSGVKAQSFFSFHLGYIPVEMVVDNDKAKQKKAIGDFISVINDSRNKTLIINSVNILNNFDNDELLIFVANKNPEPIIQQLNEMGKTNILTYEQWYHAQENMHLTQKINANKIVFFMYMHGGHERAITNKLLQYRPSLDIVWVVDKLRGDVPRGVRVLTIDSKFDCRYEAASAGVWVTGLELLDDYFKKRDGQFYIQVKHWSSLTLKKFGPSFGERVLPKDKYDNLVKAYNENNKKMDVVFTGSKFDEDSCISGWGYLGKFVRVGSSRSDVIFDKLVPKKVCKNLGICELNHLALFAPTYRWSSNQEDPCYGLEFEKLYEIIKKRFNGEWKILVRLHPLVANQASNIDMPAFVIDVSDYDDCEELAAAADLTITDYSSIMFEPAYAFKPVFLYAPDKEQYQMNHPLLLDYDKLPFSISINNDELGQAILEYNEIDYIEGIKKFFDFFNVHEDGHASERASMYILGLMDAKR